MTGASRPGAGAGEGEGEGVEPPGIISRCPIFMSEESSWFRVRIDATDTRFAVAMEERVSPFLTR